MTDTPFTGEFWAGTAARQEETFRELRRQPVRRHPVLPEAGVLSDRVGDGFWAVVRHEDILTVSRDPATFCSGQGMLLDDFPPEILRANQSFIAMDDPRHAQLRRLVLAAFTPRRLALVQGQIENQARRIVDDLIRTGDCDFVAEVSRVLPVWTVAEMMGVPQELHDALATAADVPLSVHEPSVSQGRDPMAVVAEAVDFVVGTGRELAAARRARPEDDLMTSLVQAEIDGERLTDAEIGAFFSLVVTAGFDTTRNTISHAMLALTEFPAQREWLAADFGNRARTAVEEFVRWASPVLTFRRTATRDVELGGAKIPAGDKVVMFYLSGNRDERVFADATAFDLSRSPNPHVGFGGGGPHHCFGAMVARIQLTALFGELLRRVPGIRVGDPVYLRSNFLHGITSLRCEIP
ncbi:cytochrome P450 [Streptomyces roseirectus]|uniref:Cytochrome P450 n=1 Tax=Streptomyces roseirectus TaxID=2768066 RepID=A0A7H0IPW9_9ACTN|nr:cytochrome P450 [Streptomyces roseirectus]QNP74835.1 cytochrome P450 [Streptomyces roseirectus]